MAQEKKYKIGFRLYAEVELTEEEIKAVASGDSTCIKNKYQAGEVKLGGGDSYIPLAWFQDNDEIPDELVGDVLRRSHYNDIDVDI
ncbi:MAG: hypothetical protein IKN15_04795 [Bacteroidaceae bacterium]|uniref:hypothetical protein n=1 Tax=Ralstonia pseudosolanacearum TaxID=1310165 RepID=UPI003D16E458|nr:hypothetical protein [Bacteroidaceae bacterium]